MLVTIRLRRLARLILVALAAALLLLMLAVPLAHAAGPAVAAVVVSPALVARVVGIAAAIGVLLPLLQSVLQKPWWSSRAMAILTVALAVLGGVAGYIVQNGLDFSDPTKLALWFVGAYTAATTLYARLLRPLGVTDYLENTVNAGSAPEITDGPNDDPAPADDPRVFEPADSDEVPVDADGDGRDDNNGRFTSRSAQAVADEVAKRQRAADLLNPRG